MPKPGSRFFMAFYILYIAFYWGWWIAFGRVELWMWLIIFPLWSLGWPRLAKVVPISVYKGVVLLGHGAVALWKWLLVVPEPKPKEDWRGY